MYVTIHLEERRFDSVLYEGLEIMYIYNVKEIRFCAVRSIRDNVHIYL